MIISVTRRDGSSELLTLHGPLAIRGHMLTDADGMDYFFNDDGTYDGWGRGVAGMTQEEAVRTIEIIEANRHIDPPLSS